MLFGFSDPEEMQAAMDRAEMEKDEFHHSLESIWLGLTDDQLLVLSSYFHSISHSHDGILHLAMLSGRLMQRRAERMKICALDGKDHEAELKEMSGQAGKPDLQKKKPTPEASHLDDWAEPEQQSGDPRVLKALEHADNMRKWNLEYTNSGLLVCSKCNMEYASLEDRMVKSPDNCQGCHHKAKFG